MRKYIRLLYFTFVFLIGTTAAFAQIDDEVYDDEIQDEELVDKEENKKGKLKKDRKKFNPENFYVGSGIGLGFWGSTFNLDVSPHIGYRIGNVLAPAIGINYYYANNLRADVESHVYGPKLMLRINPFGENGRFFAIGEYEFLTIKESNPYYTGTPGGQPPYYQSTLNRANVGLGYTTNFSTGVGFVTEFMLDVLAFRTARNTTNPTPYPSNLNPFTYRVGFYYGF